jgi:hypothetical protein
MGIFSGISEARASRKGIWILPGDYELEVESLREKHSRKGADLFIAELLVTASNNEQRPAGSHVTWMANLSAANPDARNAALGDLNAFFAALAKCSEDEVDEEGIEAAVSEAQPFTGHRVHCEASDIEKKDGDPFTKMLWSPSDYEPEPEAEEAQPVAARGRQ